MKNFINENSLTEDGYVLKDELVGAYNNHEFSLYEKEDELYLALTNQHTREIEVKTSRAATSIIIYVFENNTETDLCDFINCLSFWTDEDIIDNSDSINF